jgi:hypothetical protein
LLELLPVERELLSLRSKFVVPVFETLGSSELNVLGELLEQFNLNNLLD